VLVAAGLAAAILAGCAGSSAESPTVAGSVPDRGGAGALADTGATTSGVPPAMAQASPSDAPTTVAPTQAPTTAAPLTAAPDSTAAPVPPAPEGTEVAPPPDPSAPFAPTTAVRPVQPTQGAFAAFDQAILTSLFGRGAYSASIAVAKDGQLLHTQAFGTADPYAGTPITVDHRFRIASISKLLLAVAVMQLVEEGMLSLDAPVLSPVAAALRTSFNKPEMGTITLRQLLSHTSGFPVYQKTFFQGADARSCEDAATKAFGRGLESPPGTKYLYSNMNYCLLGLVVQRATGLPFEEVVQQRVLGPLGITEMRTVTTYEVRPGDVRHPTTPNRVFMEVLGAAGNWVGSAADLVRVVDSLVPGTGGYHPLPGEVVAQMLERAPVEFPHEDRWYGLGLRVWDFGEGWGHTGTLENARGMVFHRPDGITWALLVSGNPVSNTDNLRGIVDKALTKVTAWPS
jgi:D-alanyl-D-alanine carboxypeptidase